MNTHIIPSGKAKDYLSVLQAEDEVNEEQRLQIIGNNHRRDENIKNNIALQLLKAIETVKKTLPRT